MSNSVFGHLACILVCALTVFTAQGSGVNITYIESAVAKGAVCLDGSAPAYQFDKGAGEGLSNWLVHIEGGGWCESTEKCITHMSSGLGSSKYMGIFDYTGILSNEQELNPNFYNWNRVVMKYCDGSSFTGDVEEVDPVTNLHFRGARVFNAIVEEVLTKGMNNASKALMSGCSAGGLASILHCDKFRAFFPTSTIVKCLSDAGYFLHIKDISGRYHFGDFFDKIVKLHCFFPQYILPQIKTPIFVLNSAYDPYQIYFILAANEADPNGTWNYCKSNTTMCNSSQLKRLQVFKSDFVKLLGASNSSSRGWFVDSCFTHCQSENQPKWLGNPSLKINNKTISDSVGDWFYERSSSQLIDNDNELPLTCNVNPFNLI